MITSADVYSKDLSIGEFGKHMLCDAYTLQPTEAWGFKANRENWCL